MPLSKKVLSAIEKLGGELPASWDEPTTLAEPLRQFAGVQFPEGETYCTDEDFEPRVWGLELGGLDEETDAKEFGLEWDGGPLGCIGTADGGNYLVVMRLDAPRPTDPVVHVIDHYDPGQTLHGKTRLSAFLGALRTEGNARPAGSIKMGHDFAFAASLSLNKNGSTAEELKRVRTLLGVRSATSLDDLRHFPALEVLSLENCTLRNLNALRNVPRLQHLYLTDCVIGDWSGVRALSSLRGLHVPGCGLEQLSFMPEGLVAATVSPNPLGVSAMPDLARLPAASSSLMHPGAVELELNDALRARGVPACCVVWNQKPHILLTRVLGPGFAGTGKYHDWRVLDVEALRAAIADGKDLPAWILAQPQAQSRFTFIDEWGTAPSMFPMLHPA